MNEHLKLAIEAMAEVEKLAAEKETEAMNFAVSFAQAAAAIAQAAAAIAQAESAERQAVAMEKIANMLAPTISERPYP